MTAAVEFRAFRRDFGRTTAVERLDLTVEPGTIHGLLGPNGSGKTTCVRAVCGLLAPSSGEVLTLGEHARGARTRVRPRLGYMPQAAALYEDLTATENVRFFARALGVRDPETRATQLLDWVGLSERARDPVHTFSGGMRQRVSLACALVHEPELLLLDEPTAGVDPLIRRRMWRTLGELRERGTSILITTNQLDEAGHCDRLAILREGRLLAADTPEALLRRGAARVTLERGGESQTLELQDYEHELPRLLGAGDVDAVRVERASLEDVMLALVEEAPP